MVAPRIASFTYLLDDFFCLVIGYISIVDLVLDLLLYIKIHLVSLPSTLAVLWSTNDA